LKERVGLRGCRRQDEDGGAGEVKWVLVEDRSHKPAWVNNHYTFETSGLLLTAFCLTPTYSMGLFK